MAENSKKNRTLSDTIVTKSPIAKREEEILAFWKEKGVFEKSLAQTAISTPASWWQRLFGGAQKREFIFYEGPPTANGRPGIHHIEARAFKDVIPRYKTMRGFHVRRKAGWDTHGLPVELEVEKELGLKSKKEIEEYGIAAFNEKCRESVWRYIDEWEQFTQRLGYWVNQKDPYVTYKPEYIESVWNIIKHVDARGLLYKDYKVVPWCPRCGTGLSSHELAQEYHDDTELSVTAKFKVKNPEKIGISGDVYLLAWTTTPWTLPGNVALAVGEKIQYAIVLHEGAQYILAEDLAGKHFPSAKPSKTILGSELVGLMYEPLFDFLQKTISKSEKEKLSTMYQVYPADFVTTEDGTGIVHTAVMYGQEDFELGTAIGLPKQHVVDDTGRFLKGLGFLEGRFVKDEDVAVDIIKDLAHRNLLFAKEKYTHSYPHCWRCKTPLIYYARDSWYIRMSALREELLKENKTIHWEPEHIRDGRFGEWLSEVKDWALSRERYWATPLPVWQTADGNERVVVGSIDDLRAHTKKSGNHYILMRHGESESNTSGVISSRVDNVHHLTNAGVAGVRRSAEALRGKGITKIIASPLLRTRETAELIADSLGITRDGIIFDRRVQELDTGVLEGKRWSDYEKMIPTTRERFAKAPTSGETLNDLKRRLGDFIYDIDAVYTNETVLIVSHEAPLQALVMAMNGLDTERSITLKDAVDWRFDTSEWREVSFVPLPHNEYYELDLHRPYIDNIQLVSASGKMLARTPEVMDVWLDSGAMPLAQDHYPFENTAWVDGPGYPADYISEAIDQTRGWFYTLHAVGVLMGKGKAYKNVISLGHILDAEGKKMSKSVGNVVNPWHMIDRYGVDALRFWMYTINQPGESKNFDEKVVDEIVKKVFNLLQNSLHFYTLYRDSVPHEANRGSDNALDVWILARFDTLHMGMTSNLDAYKVLEAARAIREFIADLSQWYIRRSRERFKNGGEEARKALGTTKHILLELAKVIAPFMPFLAEDVYQQVGGAKESVHLESWSAVVHPDAQTLSDMEAVRSIVSLGLEVRTRTGMKVRQPLAELKMKSEKLKGKSELLGIIADEVNVKKVTIDSTLNDEVWLDNTLTPELREEGEMRDFVRGVQDMRKSKGLSPNDRPTMVVHAEGDARARLEKERDELINKLSLDGILFESRDDGEAISLGDDNVRVTLLIS